MAVTMRLRVVRLIVDLSLIALSAVAGCLLAQLMVWPRFEHPAYLLASLIFALPGVGMIATGHRLLVEHGLGRWAAYGMILVFGCLAGAGVLAAAFSTTLAQVGAVHGAACGLVWILLDLALDARKLRVKSP